MNSKNITTTEARVKGAFDILIDNRIDSSVPQMIDEAVDSVKVKTGVITKFYSYTDRAEVKLDHSDDVVLGRILHRYGGDIIDFYTPTQYEADYDDKLNEPYIVPKASQNVCVLSISEEGNEEHLILGYFNKDEIVGYNPASPGNIKLVYMNENSMSWIKFGKDGLLLNLSEDNVILDDVEDTETNVGNKLDGTDTYTKEEVDELMDSAIDELIQMLSDKINDMINDES